MKRQLAVQRPEVVLLIILSFVSVSGVLANDLPPNCATSVSFLNEDERSSIFDRKSNAKELRLLFRLRGQEPCLENECTLEIVHRVAKAETVIATIDLSHRDVLYCDGGRERIKFAHVPIGLERDGTFKYPPKGCPTEVLQREIFIKLNNERGPFSRQGVNIQYLHNESGSRRTPLDQCTLPGSIDGAGNLRAQTWTIPFDSGDLAFISEVDASKNRIGRVPVEQPYVVNILVDFK
jgi:hypothetical protein